MHLLVICLKMDHQFEVMNNLNFLLSLKKECQWQLFEDRLHRKMLKHNWNGINFGP